MIWILPVQPTKQDYGTIHSSWEKRNGKIHFEIEIPVNTTATVYAPQNGMLQKTRSLENPTFSTEGSYNVYELGSGKYLFLGTK
jgi:alpha-L-rhamnosidase